MLYLVALLATWRMGRFFTDDLPTGRLRSWAERTHPLLGYLVTCPWCVSFYPGLVVGALAAWVEGESGWAIPSAALLVALAGSAVSGLLVTAEAAIDETLARSRRR